MTVRARFDGKVFIPIDPVDIPIDQIVEIDVPGAEMVMGMRRGSPELLRHVMRQLPRLQPGDIEALERAMEHGKQPPNYEGIFDEPNDP
jgi:hypothetical protein